MTYAIISVGGKQYRVREGERLLVDRLALDEGKTFHPDVLFLGGDGEARVGAELKGVQVTAKVAAHVLGEKVIVGKHRRRTGYRRRNGHRSRLSRIEIEAIGKKRQVEIVDPGAEAEKETEKEKRTRTTRPKTSQKKAEK
jgi:large subunit ribosomal protein L21